MSQSVRDRIALRLIVIALTLAAAAPLAACASSSSGRSSSGSRDVISGEQLDAMSTRNALEAVQRLKPTWLRTRGPDASRTFPLAVAVDGVIQGGVRTLASYRCADLDEIRYLPARQAMLRFGDRAAGGAILLTTTGRK